jgi:hypothetical protein
VEFQQLSISIPACQLKQLSGTYVFDKILIIKVLLITPQISEEREQRHLAQGINSFTNL